MAHVISMETSEGHDQPVILTEANQNQSIMVNERVERTNVGETSRGHDQSFNLNEVIQNQSLTVNEEIEHTADRASSAVAYLRSKLDNEDQLIIPKLDNDDQLINQNESWNVNKNESGYVSCPKVQSMLREAEYSGCYDPKIVSFGPYHRGSEKLKAAETIKRTVMKEFFSKHGKSIEDLYLKVLEQNEHARSCYKDGSTRGYTDEDFALMMLQDGCFILALSEYEVRETLLSKYLDVFQRRYSLLDTILLENQIPFRVLNVLMSYIYEENRGLEMITSFLRNMHWGNILEQDAPDLAKEPDHLLGLQISLISKCGCPDKIFPQDFTSIFPLFGSVSDLQAEGINFKPSNSISLHSAEKKIPKSISLRDVKFRPGFFTGELILPPLLLTPDAPIYYKNLIAFEMCATFVDATITSYISFMNSLIATPEDVKVLRSKHIILHTLNSDEEVFRMLKGISGRNWQPVDVYIYQGVRKDIQKHYNSKIRIWIAKIRHKYFSQPWSVFGLLAAVVAIILSFLQTFYTIHPPKA